MQRGHLHTAPHLNAGIVLTNDGHAILREIDVTHPAAKVCATAGSAPRGGTHMPRVVGLACTRCVHVKGVLVPAPLAEGVPHPVYTTSPTQSMIQLSRTQDEEVGDGTTSVIILGEWAAACHGLRSPQGGDWLGWARHSEEGRQGLRRKQQCAGVLGCWGVGD